MDYLQAGLGLSRLPQLGTIEAEEAGGLRTLLDVSDYAVIKEQNKKNILLVGMDQRNVMTHIAGDINRLSSAGYETLCNVVPLESLPKSTAWPLVKLYYAGFYFVHSVCRACGLFTSYFNTSDLIRLRQVADAYSIAGSNKLIRGNYRIEFRRDNALSFVGIDSSGGSHESTWKLFVELIEVTRARVEREPSLLSKDKVKILAALSDLKLAALQASPNSSWLSAFRNSVQYRQDHGVWLPYSRGLKVKDLLRRASLINREECAISDFDLRGGDELSKFVESIALIILTSRKFLADLDGVGRKSFLRFGLRRTEKTLKLSWQID